ncbi:MAG: response regulator [Lachnospiraceae bacterium]|nr:response regulator [Lachnospiraceae bacterium]
MLKNRKKNKMIFIAEKESFILRVLMKKVEDAGVNTTFVKCSVTEINNNMAEDIMITLYLEEGLLPREDVMHFLVDTLDEKNMQMIIVGEQRDLDRIAEHVPRDMVFRTFPRPVDNTLFAEAITEYTGKMEAGDFKKRILVVDDDPQYLTMVREWLKDTYKVSMANSGLQAIKWLGKNKVDLILLDHEMPVTSGPQVLEMLRSEPETSSIPVMFLTGKGDKDSVMAVIALRPEGYFLKGIQKEELLEKLQEYFVLHKNVIA